MPERRTVEAARRKKELGEAPSTQAGEFVREEMHHIREGKHGARSTKQAIAIGLSKARRAGVELPTPAKGTVTEETRRGAQRDAAAGRRRGTKNVSARRSRATTRALQAEGRNAASAPALARQARTAAKKRGATARSAAAKKAARTRASVAGRGKRAHSAAKRIRRARRA